MSSTSFSVPMASTVSDLSNNIKTAVAVSGDGLVKHISQLLDLINKKKSAHPNAAHSSLSFLKLEQFLSEGINVFKDIILCQGTKDVSNLLHSSRNIHCYGLCFRNPKYFRNPFHQGRGDHSIIKQFKEATELIVEASIMCCAQIMAAIMCCAQTSASIMATLMCCAYTNTSKF